MNQYKAYHTSIKTCFSLGIHQKLLPEHFLSLIPPSTSHHWKKQHPSKYLGDELALKIESSFEDVNTLLDQRVTRLRQAFVAFTRLYLSILRFIGENQFKATLKQHRTQLVSLIDNASKHFGNRDGICKLLRISTASYKSWKRITVHGCKQSLLGICFKSFPQQISRKEISMLRKYMSESRYTHWSTAAIWAKAIRNSDISMSLASWYRYARALGITKARTPKKIPKTRKSVRANAVNEIWHMDVSHFKTEDNIKFYIYTVVDNFSRRIIKYDVSMVLSAKMRLNSLKEAIHSEFGVDLSHTPSLDLIVDGGSENNNTTINDFITSCHVDIKKKIALRDVVFSNSIVEAPYRILKSRYFQNRPILSTTIKQELDFFVNDYNNNRPHYAHVLYTPNEVAKNPALLNVKPRLQKINQERLESNRAYCCKTK
jgi:hypothetical protein